MVSYIKLTELTKLEDVEKVGYFVKFMTKAPLHYRDTKSRYIARVKSAFISCFLPSLSTEISLHCITFPTFFLLRQSLVIKGILIVMKNSFHYKA